MQILRTMRDAGIEPDVVTYTTTIKVQSFLVNEFSSQLSTILKSYSLKHY